MIHLYQNNGYNIVLDVNSGAVHVVDEIAYDVIGFLERENPLHTVESLGTEETKARLWEAFADKFAREDVFDVLEAVIGLAGEGRLFARDVYEDFKIGRAHV